MLFTKMPSPNETSPNEPALEALANLIGQLDIPETTDEKLAQEDAVFAPALIDGIDMPSGDQSGGHSI